MSDTTAEILDLFYALSRRQQQAVLQFLRAVEAITGTPNEDAEYERLHTEFIASMRAQS